MHGRMAKEVSVYYLIIIIVVLIVIIIIIISISFTFTNAVAEISLIAPQCSLRALRLALLSTLVGLGPGCAGCHLLFIPRQIH